ncbi:glycosyltransferase, partial [archaeon]
YRIGKKYGVLSFLSNLMKLKRAIKKEKPDIVYTQYLTTYGIMAGMTGFKNLALSVIGSDIYTHIKKFPFNIITKSYVNKFKMINVECEGVKSEVMKYYKYHDKVVVKNWGVDFKLFNTGIDRTEIRKRYGIGDNEKVIISARALIPRCNVETVIRAVNEIKNDVRLLVVGDGESAQQLKKIADDFGMTKTIFTGAVEHKELGKYLRAADVYAQASLGDTVSITMLDAMACGVPCVSSNVGCTSEFIRDGFNGFLIEDFTDYKKLAGHIEHILNDKELAKSFVDKSLEIVSTECEENKNMEYIEDKMKELVLSS